MDTPLYDVTNMEVATRYVGEQPVECVVFHKRDGTTVVVRLLPEQQDLLMNLLRMQSVSRLAT